MATDIASGAVSSVRCDVNSGVGGARIGSDKRADEQEDEAKDSRRDRGVRRSPEQTDQSKETTPTVVATDTAGAFATVAASLPPAETSDPLTVQSTLTSSCGSPRKNAGPAASVAEMFNNDESSDDAAAATTARLVDAAAVADGTRSIIEQNTADEGIYKRLRELSRSPWTTCEVTSSRRTRGGPNETRAYF